jgi:integrase
MREGKMTRTIRDAKLESRAARLRLEPGRKPHWKTIVPSELHLGYRRKRANEPGTWLVRRYIGDKNYRVEPLGIADDFNDDLMSFAAAQRLAQEHKTERKGKGHLTVADVIKDYVTWLEAHRACAHDSKKRAEKHILPALGDVRIAALTPVMLNKWRDSLITKPAESRPKADGTLNLRPMPQTEEERRARKATANRNLMIIRAALNHAFHNGLIESDSAWRKVRPFKDAGAARERALTVEEATRLVNAADAASGFRDLVHAALLTGARYGELTRLRVGDFANGKIAITKSKSGKPRWVRLTAEGRAFFEQLTVGRAPGDTLLEKRRKDHAPRTWNAAEQKRPMRLACRAAKMEHTGFHQLRHTWASLSVMAGVPLLVVANNLGHSDTRMVEKHYGHLTESYMDDAINEGAPRFGLVQSTNVKRLRTKRS